MLSYFDSKYDQESKMNEVSRVEAVRVTVEQYGSGSRKIKGVGGIDFLTFVVYF